MRRDTDKRKDKGKTTTKTVARTLRQRGSTIIEVLMAITVLAVGASGIMAMEKATIVANRNAKNLEIANTIASTWMQRLRGDAMLWNEVGINGDINTDTRWLKNHVKSSSAGQWFRPIDSSVAMYGVHDRFGHDDPTGQANGPFCVNIRLVWLKPGELARAEVRVYWLRDGIQPEANNLSIAIPSPLCGTSSTPVPNVDNATDVLHFVQVASALYVHQEGH